ncbi:MAG: hypothetical protein QY302_08690 [Anaerolineales bacterium]|nr:MAG: hypothetical protein QY302_08690 [Anaerolineales bacterium]
MFQTVSPQQIFDPRFWQVSEDNPAYWLAQLRKPDWQYLLKLIDVKLPVKTKKQAIAEVAFQHYEFAACGGRAEVWQLWNEVRNTHRFVVIQFRHSETGWSCGIPEFVHLERGDPLGVVNIAGWLFCRVK